MPLTAIENPMVRWKEEEPDVYGVDFYGNEVYVGDEILVLDDEFFLKEELTSDVIQLLEHLGATVTIAQ